MSVNPAESRYNYYLIRQAIFKKYKPHPFYLCTTISQYIYSSIITSTLYLYRMHSPLRGPCHTHMCWPWRHYWPSPATWSRLMVGVVSPPHCSLWARRRRRRGVSGRLPATTGHRLIRQASNGRLHMGREGGGGGGGERLAHFVCLLPGACSLCLHIVIISHPNSAGTVGHDDCLELRI